MISAFLFRNDRQWLALASSHLRCNLGGRLYPSLFALRGGNHSKMSSLAL